VSSSARGGAPLIGRTIGNYRVEELLGAGGMGAVYLVRHLQLPNTVAALKVLKEAAVESPAIAARFVQEALVAAAIGGQRVARPLDLGRLDDGKPYILMELVDGRTLAARIAAEGPLGIPALTTIACRIAETMTLAHERGIVHRDLKPSNIMLVGADELQVKLLDFGVARASGELKLAETQEAAIIGSPGYMSPEAASGGAVDDKADVYSLAATVFDMATGEPPFPASLDREALGALLTRPAPSIAAKRPRSLAPMPTEIEALIARALGKDPGARPTMRELAARLRDAAGLPPDGAAAAPSATRPPLPRAIDPIGSTMTHAQSSLDLKLVRAQAEKLARRRLEPRGARRWPWLAMAVVVVAVMGAREAWRAAPSSGKPAIALEQHQVTFRGDAHGLGISPNGKLLAYTSGEKLIVEDLELKQPRELALSDTVIDARWLSDSSAIQLLTLPANEPKLDIRISAGGALEAHPSRDSGRRVFARDGRIAVWNQSWKHIEVVDASGRSRTLPLHDDFAWVTGLDWSPDSAYLLVSTQSKTSFTLRSLSVDSGADRTILEEQTRIAGAHWLRHGVLYLRATPSNDGDLVFAPMAGNALDGRSRTLAVRLGADLGQGLDQPALSVSRDERRLAYTRAPASSELWLVTLDHPDSAHPEARATRLLGDTAPKAAPALSPDGQRIAFSSSDGRSWRVFVIPAAGGDRVSVGATPPACRVAWSPDGSRLAFADVVTDRLQIVPLDGGAARQLRADLEEGGTVLTWRGGDSIIYQARGNRTLDEIDARTSESRRHLGAESAGWLFAPRTSPDGRLVAAMWNRRRDQKDHPGHGLWVFGEAGERWLVEGNYAPIGWSRDGRWIYAAPVGGSRNLFRVSVDGGPAQPWLTLPLARDAVECDVSADGTRLACVALGDSDVWLVDNLDELIGD
jgi:dipeptidyl aminopeptidase/acylaminoacyl peptidase